MIIISQEYVIETQNLEKIYKTDDVKAVNGLNLKVKKGEIYGFIGANGSGKTTTINMLTGTLKPTSGSIKILDMDAVKHRYILAPDIGIAPQDYSIYPDLTVKENIRFFAKLYGIHGDKLKTKMKQLLNIIHLQDEKDTLGKNLSGGMKRRVSLAAALIHEPKVVFIDEATVGVDPILRNFFWDYFRKLRDEGTTLVITSHVMDEAEKADRIGLMRAGKLIEEGTPSELKDKYAVETIEEIFLLLSTGVKINEI